MALEIVIGIAALALLTGAGIGYLLGKGKDNSARVRELEGALENSQSELADYRTQVYGNFAETAEKFRALDRSYNDLHRQLAESSVALCGDDAQPLLAGPGQPKLTEAEQAARDEREEKEINPAPVTAQAPNADAADEVQPAMDVAPEQATNTDTESEAETQTPTEAQTETQTDTDPAADQPPASAAAEVGEENIVVGETTDVPVLTDVQKENAAESASADTEVEPRDQRQGSA